MGHGGLVRRGHCNSRLVLQAVIMEGFCWIWRVWADVRGVQRQTVVSQFYQLDRLVVEGGKTVSLHIHTRRHFMAGRVLSVCCCQAANGPRVRVSKVAMKVA